MIFSFHKTNDKWIGEYIKKRLKISEKLLEIIVFYEKK